MNLDILHLLLYNKVSKIAIGSCKAYSDLRNMSF